MRKRDRASGRSAEQPPLFDDTVLPPLVPPPNAGPAPAEPIPVNTNPPIDLVRSFRRARTYKWSIVDGRVRLEVPAGLQAIDEQRIVEQVARQAQQRISRSARPSDSHLFHLAHELARSYLPEATPKLCSVVWSDRQEQRWGSCTSATGAIRLSSRLDGLPHYVLEAVLFHELAHLVEPNHSRRFHTLANRYPLAERARGFLEAVDRRVRDAADDWADELD